MKKQVDQRIKFLFKMVKKYNSVTVENDQEFNDLKEYAETFGCKLSEPVVTEYGRFTSIYGK